MRARSFVSLASFVVLALAACRPSSTSSSSVATAVSATPSTAPFTSASSVPKFVVHAPLFHRAAAAACPARPRSSKIVAPPSEPNWQADVAKPDHHDCLTDADCMKGKNARCLIETQSFRGAVVGTFARCSYDACQVDADCPNGDVCSCRGDFGGHRTNSCLVAGCRTDAECGAFACSPTFAVTDGCRSEGVPFDALQCHGPDDECVDDKDCAATYTACVYSSAKKHWVCNGATCLPD